MTNEFGLTRPQVKNLLHVYDDLKIQAMMFDMDIDIETWSLVPKRKDTMPTWLRRWKEKVSEGDDGPESAFEAYA